MMTQDKTYNTLTVEISNKIAHIKLNRPDEFN